MVLLFDFPQHFIFFYYYLFFFWCVLCISWKYVSRVDSKVSCWSALPSSLNSRISFDFPPHRRNAFFVFNFFFFSRSVFETISRCPGKVLIGVVAESCCCAVILSASEPLPPPFTPPKTTPPLSLATVLCVLASHGVL